MKCPDVCHSEYTHPACHDEMSCGCQIVKDDREDDHMCTMCEEDGCNGCGMECSYKTLADSYLLVMLFTCAFGGGGETETGGTCVSIPSNDPIWQNDIWNRYKPRNCAMAVEG